MSRDRADKKVNPPGWLRALGRSDLPATITVGEATFRHVRTYKHDFFAATGLYEDADGKAVLKIGRVAPICGIPMTFIGAMLQGRERRMLEAVAGIEGVPAIIGWVGRTGLVREFIEGAPLTKDEHAADDFFPALRALLDRIHARDMAYVDLEKRENILHGADGRPYLIDFQISWRIGGLLGRTWPCRWILRMLQRSDRYHLMKHWRRYRPDQLNDALLAEAEPPIWISAHRLIFRPFTRMRRQVLVWLGARSNAHGRSPG